MKKSALILLLIVASFRVFAQQDPIFTQYMFNKVAINPAYAGSSEALSIDIIDRFQWVGVKDGPNTMSFAGHTNLKNPHLGLGLYTYRDALGPTVETGVMGSFAYRILFPKGTLSMGAQFGFDYLDIDWSALNPENPNDPLLNDQVKNRAVPDAGVGFYYYTPKYYIGISSTHLLQNRIVVSQNADEDKTSFSKLMRHFYAMSGVVIPINENLDFRPAALVKYTQNAPVQADLSLSVLINKVLWLGVSYRTENCLTAMAEINIRKNLHIGYSYDAWFNQLSSYNHGSHEIRIGYDFDLFHTNRMPEVRYF
ncbi:MAG TPA: type IX secretion system membrane protein PorP/SprF [Bacteroidales bacterium]|nr:type IX secretion system membrane protein PorP/SprF [Bacteroidales bacterium]HPS74333.1 type IX secretion system membrane protein PorP/SprF [Bacteroidales bacterium]